MRAFILDGVHDLRQERAPLRQVELPEPEPGPGELLLQVLTCGVCHTELDEIEGRAPPSRYPMVPGHQIVGRVIGRGAGAARFELGERVGVGWIHSACGACAYCEVGHENLCADFVATGRDAWGGYAERMVVPEGSAARVPAGFSDAEAAPLLCAGAIGYRSLLLADMANGQRLGLTGFGASAHLVLKLARHRYPRSPVFVFARSERERAFALDQGAAWAGDTTDRAPALLDRIIDTTPAWRPVIEALANLGPGGRLVINAIRKEEADKAALLELDYPAHLWMEKEIKSVANVTRRDVRELMALAGELDLRPEVQGYDFEAANEALLEIKERRIRGAKVLQIGAG